MRDACGLASSFFNRCADALSRPLRDVGSCARGCDAPGTSVAGAEGRETDLVGAEGAGFAVGVWTTLRERAFAGASFQRRAAGRCCPSRARRIASAFRCPLFTGRMGVGSFSNTISSSMRHTVRMAQKIHVILTDDIDGDSADETIVFSLDGVQYEIDLSESNASRFRDQLAPFVSNARRVGGRKKPAGVAAKRSDLDEIRRWGRANGYEVSDRGRMPTDLMRAYEAHNN